MTLLRRFFTETPFFVWVFIAIFFGFGLFHLSEFETVDEHFWKYERIPQYWTGIREGLHGEGWKKTNINDKPGITVALISGIGLLAEPHPETHQIRDPQVTQDKAYTVYDTSRTGHINLSFRLPILIAGTVALFAFFRLLLIIVEAREKNSEADPDTARSRAFRTATLAVGLIATSPVLVGMSQIINPDALLWIFMPLALLSFWAFLETDRYRFVWWTGVLTGLAILTKYTANILFPILIIAGLLFILVRDTPLTRDRIAMLLKRYTGALTLIAGISIIMFCIFFPAVFEKPKHLLNGTLFSPALEPILVPLAAAITALLIDAWILRGHATAWIAMQIPRLQRWIVGVFAGSILLFILLSFVNVALKGAWVPLDDIKEQLYDNGTMFTLFANDPWPIMITKEVLAEVQSLPFSWLPLQLGILIVGLGLLVAGRLRRLAFPFLLIGTVWWVFVAGAIVSDIFLTYRYAIILYPLLAILSAFLLVPFLERLTERTASPQSLIWPSACAIILTCGTTALWLSKPHFLNYSNVLLPKEYVLVDSWGYGEYEAAMYLNSLPNARNLAIWSDRSGVCQFFVGRCIRSSKIDLSKTVPEYFVFSRRGAIRTKFTWKRPELAKRSFTDYYEEETLSHPAWQISIGGREKNFVKVIKTEESDH